MVRTVGIAVVCALTMSSVAAPVTDPLAIPKTKPTTVSKPTSKPTTASKSKKIKKSKRTAKPTKRKRTKSRAKPKLVAKLPPPVVDSQAANRSIVVEPDEDTTTTAAYRYGMLSTEACLAELMLRRISYTREGPTLGVVTPVRLAGAVRGIEFRTNQDAKQRATSRWEIADCRLVLALDDYAQILARHDVVEVRHYSMYRTPPTSFSSGDVAKRHPGGLALDAARFIKRDGSYLDVEEHYHGRIGQRSCGDDADPPSPATPEATELRAILCETATAKLFNVVLTPNHDRPHHNHFHLEVTPGVKWFIVK